MFEAHHANGHLSPVCDYEPRQPGKAPNNSHLSVGSRRSIKIEQSGECAYAREGMVGGDRPVSWMTRVCGTSHGSGSRTNRIASTIGRVTLAGVV